MRIKMPQIFEATYAANKKGIPTPAQTASV